MKVLNIEAQKKSFVMPNIDSLPARIGLIYTIQYKPLFEKIKKELEKNGHIHKI